MTEQQSGGLSLRHTPSTWVVPALCRNLRRMASALDCLSVSQFKFF
jgi:hypothetical protein